MTFEPKLYNPAAQPEDWLIEHFVVRTKVFEQIFADIKTGTMETPEQHYLIQGQRGMGKTTLLLRLKYEIERTPELNTWLLPVFFNEDTYDLTSLSSLWEKLIKYFDANLPGGGNFYAETNKYIGKDDYEQKCFELVLTILHEHGKKIVLLFDNFGELFLDNLDERDSHRLREILMNCREIRIIAASAVVLESHNDYSQPFFDFFRIVNLDGLSKEETIELIEKLQEKSEQKIDLNSHKSRIETLSILTGGVIRTIVMLYEILLNDSDGSALNDLEKILDRVTPLYKHRMEGLKPQQRRIMDVIAKNWDAIGVKQISENIREKGKPVLSKIISAQLQELERNNFIEKRKTSTKNNFYLVKERFFNIWYLMRHGDQTTQCKVKWLTRYLEMWYDDNGGMDIFINEYIKKLQSGSFRTSSALTLTNALLLSSKVNSVAQALLLHFTETMLPQNDQIKLPKVDEYKIDQAIEKFQNHDYDAAIDILNQLSPKNILVLKFLGMAHFGKEEYEKCIHYLSALPSSSIDTYCNYTLGLAYNEINDNENCLANLLLALPDFEKDISGLIGDLYFQKGDYRSAEKYLARAAEFNETTALFTLSQIYVKHFHDTEKAIGYLEKIVEIDPKNWIAFGQLASLYGMTKRPYQQVENAIHKCMAGTDNQDNYIMASTMLALLYLENKINKQQSLGLVDTIERSKYSSALSNIISANICVWNNEIERGLLFLQKSINEDIDDYLPYVNDCLIMLLAKKQYHLVLKVFSEDKYNLKEKLKPTYYALMFLLIDEYPDGYIKIGKELNALVQEILEEIKQMSIDYA